jgi:hypothetical protein
MTLVGEADVASELDETSASSVLCSTELMSISTSSSSMTVGGVLVLVLLMVVVLSSGNMAFTMRSASPRTRRRVFERKPEGLGEGVCVADP